MKTANEVIVAALDPALRNGLAENRTARILANLKAAGFAIVPITPTRGMEEQAAHNLSDEYGAEKVLGLRKFALDAYGEFINAGQAR